MSERENTLHPSFTVPKASTERIKNKVPKPDIENFSMFCFILGYQQWQLIWRCSKNLPLLEFKTQNVWRAIQLPQAAPEPDTEKCGPSSLPPPRPLSRPCSLIPQHSLSAPTKSPPHCPVLEGAGIKVWQGQEQKNKQHGDRAGEIPMREHTAPPQ